MKEEPNEKGEADEKAEAEKEDEADEKGWANEKVNEVSLLPREDVQRKRLLDQQDGEHVDDYVTRLITTYGKENEEKNEGYSRRVQVSCSKN